MSDEPFWKKYGYSSYEAMVEAKAGSWTEDQWLDALGEYDWACMNDPDSNWPMPDPPAYPEDARIERMLKWYPDWPMPNPPPYPADDEDDIVPEPN